LGTRWCLQERSAELREQDYLRACEHYRQSLANQQIKRGPEKFISVRDYLAEKYLDHDHRLREDARHDLTRTKSEHIAERTGSADNNANWLDAETYVVGFYDNIISAVMQPGRERVECVRQAILRSEGKRSRASIMNVFEAAIYIYFLKGFEYFADDWKTPTQTG
jgi:hypothetical protein